MELKTIEFKDGKLYLLDQRALPAKEEYFVCTNYNEVILAIKEMVVRGAPAIGATGAFGVVLAAKEYLALPLQAFKKETNKASKLVGEARPTAVNLIWAVNIMLELLEKSGETETQEDIYKKLLQKALEIYDEDIIINKKLAEYGNELIPHNAVILTHCNTGSLATVDYGTALGVIREAHSSGKHIHVFADETRPRLQGAKLTAFELVKEGIPATLIVDSVGATLMRDGKIDLIIVGADRIASNGDTANKIGTYMLSELAKSFKIPFYIAAPLSTIDRSIAGGAEIVIEERDAKEVLLVGEEQVAPLEINVYNPAFDVTPNENITAIITEKGILKPPYSESIAKIFA